MSTTYTTPPQAPVPAGRPPRRRRWLRNAGIAAVTILAVAGAGSLIGQAASHSSRPAPSAPAVSAPAVPPAPAYDDAGYLAAASGPRAQAVLSDLQALSADAGAFDMAGVRADGARLERDSAAWQAAILAAHPSPAYAAHRASLLAAIAHIRQAGRLAAAGDLVGATAALADGTADLKAADRALPPS